VKYLSYDTLLKIHQDQVETFGGEDGLRDQELLKSSHRQPLQTYGGTEIYSSLIDKTAVLGYGIINNHPFVDGNKRTGTAAMILLLEINGMQFQAENKEIVEMARSVASDEMNREDLSHWLEDHTTEH
jgi:death-on-curing protein